MFAFESASQQDSYLRHVADFFAQEETTKIPSAKTIETTYLTRRTLPRRGAPDAELEHGPAQSHAGFGAGQVVDVSRGRVCAQPVTPSNVLVGRKSTKSPS